MSDNDDKVIDENNIIKKKKVDTIEVKPKKKSNKKNRRVRRKDDQKITLTVKVDNFKVIERTFLRAIPKHSLNIKKYLIIVCIVLLISLGFFMAYKKYTEYQDEQRIIKEEKEHNKQVALITSHYNQYVRVATDSKLYKKKDDTFYEYGMAYKDSELELDEQKITYDTKYFYSSKMDVYIEYDKVEKIDSLTSYSDRFKSYIPFNQNIVTKDVFSLYDDDNKVWSFNESMSFPIIIKDYDGKYYVNYNNRLLYVLKEDVQKIVNAKNTSISNASRITTLCYHRVYDMNEKCNDIYICKKKSNFDKEMKYLKDNNYLTLTMEETYLYLTKKLQVPRRSVVITLDDGHLIKSAIDVLEKYKLYATSFVKSKAFDDLSGFKSDYLYLGSHTHNMHTPGVCPIEREYQQGGGILCLPSATVLNDLKTSREKLNNTIALAYPFYDYNERAINLVKQAGFKIAFIGSNGVTGRSYPGINVYKVPRITMWDNTSFETFKNYVTN